MVKNPDGTTKIIQQTIPASKVVQASSLSSVSSSISSSGDLGSCGAAVASSSSTSSASSSISTAPSPGAQKVQIIRGPDGKVSVRGLNPGQQLIQMSDGKLHVLTTNQSGGQTKTVLKSNAPSTPKTVVSTTGATTIKAAVTPQQQQLQQSPMSSGAKTPVVVRQQIAKATTVVTSAASSPASTTIATRTLVTPKTQKRVC